MKVRRHILGAGLFLLAVASASVASANTAVRATSIAEGETFELSPFAFEVQFSQAVQLVNARLVDQEGREAPLDLSFYRGRSRNFVIELPVLVPHGYRLHWRIRADAGADQQGSVGFVVKGCEDPRAVTAPAPSPPRRSPAAAGFPFHAEPEVPSPLWRALTRRIAFLASACERLFAHVRSCCHNHNEKVNANSGV